MKENWLRYVLLEKIRFSSDLPLGKFIQQFWLTFLKCCVCPCKFNVFYHFLVFLASAIWQFFHIDQPWWPTFLLTPVTPPTPSHNSPILKNFVTKLRKLYGSHNFLLLFKCLKEAAVLQNRPSVLRCSTE